MLRNLSEMNASMIRELQELSRELPGEILQTLSPPSHHSESLRESVKVDVNSSEKILGLVEETTSNGELTIELPKQITQQQQQPHPVVVDDVHACVCSFEQTYPGLRQMFPGLSDYTIATLITTTSPDIVAAAMQYVNTRPNFASLTNAAGLVIAHLRPDRRAEIVSFQQEQQRLAKVAQHQDYLNNLRRYPEDARYVLTQWDAMLTTQPVQEQASLHHTVTHSLHGLRVAYHGNWRECQDCVAHAALLLHDMETAGTFTRTETFAQFQARHTRRVRQA